ncbi:MAG: 50S ribosomal protein L10 [Elusimicrobia bacterium]|nr:50S ribosomal protein L10 [Elusimicrobiota bacterium]
MPNKKNQETVQKLEEKLKESPNLVLTAYQGLTTTELNDLRSKLKPIGCEYNIVKNTLTRLSLDKVGLKEFTKYFTGPTALAFHKGDPSGLAKVIVEFSKSNEKLKIIAGYLCGKVLSDKEIKVLSTLPSREVLLTKIAVLLKMPIQRCATVLNAPLQKLALTLKSLEQQKAKAA